MRDLRDIKQQQGYSLFELLAALLLLSWIALGMTYSSIYGFRWAKGNIRNSVAAQLALAKMEELAATDPSTLSASTSATETGLTVKNVRYTRQTTVTVGADGAPTVTVTVTGGSGDMNAQATITSRFVLWGNV